MPKIEIAAKDIGANSSDFILNINNIGNIDLYDMKVLYEDNLEYGKNVYIAGNKSIKTHSTIGVLKKGETREFRCNFINYTVFGSPKGEINVDITGYATPPWKREIELKKCASFYPYVHDNRITWLHKDPKRRKPLPVLPALPTP